MLRTFARLAVPTFLLFILLPASGRVSPGRAQACTHPYRAGIYRGTGQTRLLAEDLQGAPANVHDRTLATDDITDLALKVECDGRVTGTASARYSQQALYTAVGDAGELVMLISGTSSMQPRERLEGTIETGAGGLPLFRLTATVESGSLLGKGTQCVFFPAPGVCVPVDIHDEFAGKTASIFMQADSSNGDLLASRGDGATWGAPRALTSDTNADFAPSAAVDGVGNVMVVWMRHTSPALDANITLDAAYLSGFDIWWARYDATTDLWTSPAPLTANGTLDRGPRVVAASDGTLLAIWVANAGNRLAGTAAQPDSLVYSVWRGAAWSPPARATNDSAADEFPRVVYDVANAARFFWRRDGALVTASGAPSVARQTLADALPAPPALAAGPDGRLLVGFGQSCTTV